MKGSFDEEDTHELLDSVAYWADVVFLLYRFFTVHDDDHDRNGHNDIFTFSVTAYDSFDRVNMIMIL